MSSQQPLVQPTYSIANPHQAQQNPYIPQQAVPPNAVDLTAEQLQALSLGGGAATRQPPQGQPVGQGQQQPGPFYPPAADWQAAMAAVAGFQPGLPTAGSYQPVTSGSEVVAAAAYMDPALAMLGAYAPPQILQPQPQQPASQSTSSPTQTPAQPVNEGSGNQEVDKEASSKQEKEPTSSVEENKKKPATGKKDGDNGEGQADEEKGGKKQHQQKQQPSTTNSPSTSTS